VLAVEGIEPIPTPVHHLLDDGSFAITAPVAGVLAGMVISAGNAGVQRNRSASAAGPGPLCVRLRVENKDGDHDVRLPFLRPVDDVTGLSQAIPVLMGCPFLYGIRARRR
jgi:hypothetical protein